MASFASDNTAPVHPKVLEALIRANEGHAPAYGNDRWTQKLQETLCDLFGRDNAVVFPVFNGSACNGLALSACLRPYEAVVAHEHSHINHDECGLPEFFTGAKIMSVAGPTGKISPADAEPLIEAALNHAPHTSRPGAISLTQSTEFGTVYSLGEIAQWRALANENDMYIHMDGARLANAVASLGCTAAEMVRGVDILSFGGTKAGAMLAEAVVIFNPALAHGFAYRHKRSGQLPSKARYVSAQLLALTEGDLWLELAAQANGCAARLAEGLSAIEGVSLCYPVQANAVFADLPPALSAHLLERGHRFYPWPQSGKNAFRFVTSYQTADADIDAFLSDCQHV